MNTILIQKIQVCERLRKVRTEAVTALAESIKTLGLLNPVLVTPIHEDDTPEAVKAYRLVAGHHRLEACKQLGMTEIGVNIVTIGEVDQRLAEIDENLCRAELNHLERAEHLVARKSLYETKYPETKNGSKGGGRDGIGTKHRGENEKKSFSVDTAKKTGKTERNIQQAVRRAKNISQDIRDVIRDVETIADNVSELDALAKMNETEQKSAVQAVLDGKAQSIREAARKLNGDTPPKQKETEKQVNETEAVQDTAAAMSPEEAQEWKRKAKLTSTEVLAAKERIRTLNKEKSTLKAKVRELENPSPTPEDPHCIDRFHDALDNIATEISSDPTLMTAQDLISLRNHLLKTVSIIEEMMTAINQPFSQWGE